MAALAPEDASTPRPARFSKADQADLIEAILVPEDDRWLLAVAAPLAAKLGTVEAKPVLLALSSPPSKGAVSLLKQLAPRRSLVLSIQDDTSLARGIEELRADVAVVGLDPVRAGLLIARKHWGQSKAAFIAGIDDPEAMILASALAAHSRLPFVPVIPTGNTEALAAQFRAAGIHRVHVVAEEGERAAAWVTPAHFQVEVCDLRGAQERLVEKIGPQNVRTIVLCRSPTDEGDRGGASWLAPFLSLRRSAPVCLSRADDGAEAEREAMQLIETQGLVPRSVTILADYDSVPAIPLRDTDVLEAYEVDIEPCLRPFRHGAVAWDVGRIPCTRLADASALIARGLLRSRLLPPAKGRVLMIANPSTAYGPLPLCETISRASAREFKNAGLRIREFYGKPADEPAVFEAAVKAHLIIYHGHVYDQRLFEALWSCPGDGEDLPLADEPEPERHDVDWFVFDTPPSVSTEGAAQANGSLDGRRRTAGTATATLLGGPAQPSGESPTSPQRHGPSDGMATQTHRADGSPSGATPPAVEPGMPGVAEDAIDGTGAALDPLPPVPQIDQLEGLPLVILQSCHSLEEPVARVIFEAGAVALVGSATNIHSASGSAFIKAFCDALLYRDSTLGEALRDARNYFLCLGELKKLRGHREQAKVYRVGLSFRLWGDPEVKVPHGGPPKAKIPPVTAKFEGPNKLVVSVPTKRLGKLATEKYFMRLYPGSEAAGIVKRLKGKEIRRVAPIYFFRLPLPEGFVQRGYSRLAAEGDTSPRGAFLPDTARRLLYVVYFPDKEICSGDLELSFSN